MGFILQDLNIFDDQYQINMKRKLLIIVTALLLSTEFASAQYIGQIVLFAGNFAPTGWAFCDGSILPILQNQALYSILGTTYGGNGTSTFALPDLRGKVPVGQGQGPTLSKYNLGQSGGVASVNLSVTEMPAHTHVMNNLPINCDNTTATSNSPVDAVPAIITNGTKSYSTTKNALMHTSVGNVGILPAGGSQPHNNIKPTIAINYIIALQGLYPPRN